MSHGIYCYNTAKFLPRMLVAANFRNWWKFRVWQTYWEFFLFILYIILIFHRILFLVLLLRPANGSYVSLYLFFMCALHVYLCNVPQPPDRHPAGLPARAVVDRKGVFGKWISRVAALGRVSPRGVTRAWCDWKEATSNRKKDHLRCDLTNY